MRHLVAFLSCLALVSSCDQDAGQSHTAKPRTPPSATENPAPAATTSPQAEDVAIAPVSPPPVSAERIAELLATYKIEIPEPALHVGGRAPALATDAWLKGGPATIEAGKTNIIELWATWCRPCVEAIPHLSMLAKEYGGSRLNVIAVNIESDNRERVEAFVEKNGRDMHYAVGFAASNQVGIDWIRASGLPGLPATFVVDSSGVIAWLGHPSELRSVIEKMMDDRWDATKERQRNQYQRLANPYFELAANLLETDPNRGYELVEVLLASVLSEQPRQLGGLANFILEAPTLKRRDLQVAYQAGAMACQLTEWKQPKLIELVSKIREKQGKLHEAAALQQRAVVAAGTDSGFKERLDQLRQALSAAAPTND